MRPKITGLTKCPDCSAGDQECLIVLKRALDRLGTVPWRIDGHRQEKPREDPIVKRILEDVEKRHGAIAEAMDEYSLILAFSIVKQDESQRQLLHSRMLKWLAPDSRSVVIDEWVYKQGTSLLMNREVNYGEHTISSVKADSHIRSKRRFSRLLEVPDP